MPCQSPPTDKEGVWFRGVICGSTFDRGEYAFARGYEWWRSNPFLSQHCRVHNSRNNRKMYRDELSRRLRFHCAKHFSGSCSCPVAVAGRGHRQRRAILVWRPAGTLLKTESNTYDSVWNNRANRSRFLKGGKFPRFDHFGSKFSNHITRTSAAILGGSSDSPFVGDMKSQI